MLIGGATINNIHLECWRRRCGVVMQDGVIFSESIVRNIAVIDGTIDRLRVEEAARIACIDDYIMSLPLKYDTKVGRNGMGLSQGQKQRLLIARAVYKNPDFLILDEATNSLDAKNERMIVDNLDKFCKGRTVLVVAHRLSTVMSADQIVVLSGDECRSEKVRRIIGGVPPLIVRCGTGIVVVVTVIALFIICLLIGSQSLSAIF